MSECPKPIHLYQALIFDETNDRILIIAKRALLDFVDIFLIPVVEKLLLARNRWSGLL